MFADRNVSWTVEQSGCIFSVTIAGFPVLDSAIGNGFLMLLQAFAKLYIPHMPKFCVPTFGNGRNNTKTACICLYRVSFFNMYWETWRYFQRPRKNQANVISGHAGIPPDCVRLAEKLALVAFRLFPRPLWYHATGLLRSRRAGNQRMSLKKCANFVIVWTDWRMHGTLV